MEEIFLEIPSLLEHVLVSVSNPGDTEYSKISTAL